jgi:hypothetical protein
MIGFMEKNKDGDDYKLRLFSRNLKIAPLDGVQIQKIGSCHLVCMTGTRPPVSSRSEHSVVVTSRCEPMLFGMSILLYEMFCGHSQGGKYCRK